MNTQLVSGVSPKSADFAIVSTDIEGNSGELNQYVMKEYGYSEKYLPRAESLKKGFYFLEDKGERKPILFIVTLGTGNVSDILEVNLKNGLESLAAQISGTTVWLPLMGTGAGALSLEASYSAIIKVLNSLDSKLNKIKFLISIPPSERGESFMDTIDQSLSKIAFSEFEGRFFMAGCSWEGDDQSQRFFEEGVWENGYDEKYIDIVKSVHPGDIIFLKSTYALRRIGYLRIKGVGQVISNPGTGLALKVDWKIKDIEINIERLGKYRKTFARVMPDDLETILNEVGKEKMVNAGLLNPVKGKSTYANLIADAATGDDYLRIDDDVVAFSKIMAAKSFTPPLSIALFGKWGSGKSFFMNKLIAKIDEYTQTSETSPYCKGIAQIHFNAWSYLDANLWASVVTRIFEGLHEYITKDTKASQYKKEIEKELSQQLNVTREEIQLFTIQKDKLKKLITSLENQKKSLDEKLNKNISEIETKSLEDIISNVNEQFRISEKISEALQNNATYSITREELKKIVPEKYWKNPTVLYNQIQSKYTFLREFFGKEKIGKNLTWLAIILLLIFSVPEILAASIPKILEIIEFFNLKNVNLLILQAGLSIVVTFRAIWKRAKIVYKKLRPLVASFWSIKEDYEKQIEEALFKHQQEEKALALKIEQRKVEIDVINEKIEQAHIAKKELDFRIENTLATEALYSFIAKRSESEDYQKYLGIVSIIRKDFEILSDLFLEHNEESDRNKEFRSKFNRPLERIILYIDDLDRCQEDRVVEVLEAANLLMSFPLFIVVVGVDPRWIKNALIKKHHLQFTGQINGCDLSTEQDVIEVTNYLEKIFQVPFHLKEVSDDIVKDMLEMLSSSETESAVPENGKEQDHGEQISPEDIRKDLPDEKSDRTVILKRREDTMDKIPDHPESLSLSKEEIALMRNLSRIIGNNPRAVKRFVNIYHIVRTHEALHYDARQEEKEFLIMMFLLALPIGPYKKLSPYFNAYIADEDDRLKHLYLSNFLTSLHEIEELTELKRALDNILTGEKSLNILKNEPVASFKKHHLFIQRFTFEDCQ